MTAGPYLAGSARSPLAALSAELAGDRGWARQRCSSRRAVELLGGHVAMAPRQGPLGQARHRLRGSQKEVPRPQAGGTRSRRGVGVAEALTGLSSPSPRGGTRRASGQAGALHFAREVREGCPSRHRHQGPNSPHGTTGRSGGSRTGGSLAAALESLATRIVATTMRYARSRRPSSSARPSGS